VIVNPRSRSGATERRWKVAAPRLRSALGAVEVEHTRGPRDAERLAREGVRAGIERIVVAGGDGTLSEVASGLLAADLARYAQIGLLPFGTGGDFARSLGIPRDLDAAIDCLAAGGVRYVDAGRVTYCDLRGGERISYYVNVASFGVSGLAGQLVNDPGSRFHRFHRFGGRLAFAVAALRAIRRHRSAAVAIRVDGVSVYAGPLSLGVTANGRFFGGGMRIAPDACIDDGQLDVVVVPHLSASGLLARLPAIYRGTHLRGGAAVLHRGRVVEAAAPSAAVLLELDGEPLGILPARFEVLPAALAMIGPVA
jgi:YegS/Rv2252/BmrU family lipid kinase